MHQSWVRKSCSYIPGVKSVAKSTNGGMSEKDTICTSYTSYQSKIPGRAVQNCPGPWPLVNGSLISLYTGGSTLTWPSLATKPLSHNHMQARYPGLAAIPCTKKRARWASGNRSSWSAISPHARTSKREFVVSTSSMIFCGFPFCECCMVLTFRTIPCKFTKLGSEAFATISYVDSKVSMLRTTEGCKYRLAGGTAWHGGGLHRMECAKARAGRLPDRRHVEVCQPQQQ